MKQIAIKLDEATHKAAKIRAVMQDKSFMQYVIDLIKKDLATKMSKHADFGETRDCSTEKPANSRNPSDIISDSALKCKEEIFL